MNDQWQTGIQSGFGKFFADTELDGLVIINKRRRGIADSIKFLQLLEDGFSLSDNFLAGFGSSYSLFLSDENSNI